MDSVPQIHLVDITGLDVPITEKNGVPHDPCDAATWPAWTDSHRWVISDPDELAALEHAAAEADADAADAPRPISGGAPEPSDADRSWVAQHDDQADDGMSFPREVTAAEKLQRAADVVQWFLANPGA